GGATTPSTASWRSRTATGSFRPRRKAFIRNGLASDLLLPGSDLGRHDRRHVAVRRHRRLRAGALVSPGAPSDPSHLLADRRRRDGGAAVHRAGHSGRPLRVHSLWRIVTHGG